LLKKQLIDLPRKNKELNYSIGDEMKTAEKVRSRKFRYNSKITY